MASSVVTISGLARSSGRDRATVRRRLEAANLKPKSSKPTEKLYDRREATRALAVGDGNGESSGLTEARRKKTIAEAARITLKLQRERGDLVPLNEIRDALFQFVKAMHTRIARRYPKENAGRLRKCRGAADLAHTLEVDLSLIFDELKRDYPQML
jgi:hypothetical protein